MHKLLREAKPSQWLLALACLMLLLGQIVFELAIPGYMGRMTIALQMPDCQRSDVWQIGSRMLLCIFLSLVLMVLCGSLMAQIATNYGFQLRKKLFSKISGFDQTAMEQFSVEDLVARTTEDVHKMELMLTMGLQLAIKAPVLAALSLAKMLELRLNAGISVGLCLLCFFAVFYLHIRKKQRHSTKNYKHAAALQLTPALSLSLSCLLLLVFWLGVCLLARTEIFTLRIHLFGDLMVFLCYTGFAMTAVCMMLMAVRSYPEAKQVCSRILQVLETDGQMKSGTRTVGPERGTLEFRHVTFRYPGSCGNAVTDLSFRLQRGETLAVAGESGSGKTTLLNLAARIYDPDEGIILLDGADIREYTMEALYEKLGLVPSHASLFPGTVEENINFGTSQAIHSEDQAWQMLTLTRANDFVEQMPEGLQQKVENSSLNEDQRQRLAMARALARRPELLLMDDCFSNLERETTEALLENLREELTGITKIITGNEPGAAAAADQVLILDHGKAAGFGPASQLEQTCPVYQKLLASNRSA